MEEDGARQIAIIILDEFEEMLARKDIVVPSNDREGRPEEACIYGTEYYELEDATTGILMEAAGRQKKPPTRSIRGRPNDHA